MINIILQDEKKYLGIIFDMDGVIIDTAELHERAWSHIAEKYDFPWNPMINFRKEIFGRTSSDSVQLLFNSYISNNNILQKIFEEKNHIYQELLNNNIIDIIMPGFEPFFKMITTLKIPIVLATSSPSSEASFVLKTLGIYDAFYAIIDIFQVNKPKPDPEIYFKACKSLNFSPNQCIGFEDSLVGIKALNDAGINCIVIGSSLSHDELRENRLNYIFYIPDFSYITVDGYPFLINLLK